MIQNRTNRISTCFNSYRVYSGRCTGIFQEPLEISRLDQGHSSMEVITNNNRFRAKGAQTNRRSDLYIRWMNSNQRDILLIRAHLHPIQTYHVYRSKCGCLIFFIIRRQIFFQLPIKRIMIHERRWFKTPVRNEKHFRNLFWFGRADNMFTIGGSLVYSQYMRCAITSD